MKFQSEPPKARPVPVWKIVSYVLGIVFTSFILAHFVGQGLTREGEPASSESPVKGAPEPSNKSSKDGQ